MSRKPRLLLLDAGAIFAALSHECWDALVEAYDVAVGATIVREEAIFFTNQGGDRIEIDLTVEVARGRIREVEMTALQVQAVRQRFDRDFRERLDDGELESIAYLLQNPAEDIRFVSGDGPAIEAVAMLDDDARALSLEEALEYCGQTKHLQHQFRREFTQSRLREGSMRRIQRRGLS